MASDMATAAIVGIAVFLLTWMILDTLGASLQSRVNKIVKQRIDELEDRLNGILPERKDGDGD